MSCSRNSSTVTWFMLSLFFFALHLCTANDRINQSQYISDGQTLVSDGQSFVLGFFSPANTHHRYIGIWFNTNKFSIQSVVWVANREIPLTDSSGVLKIADDGNLLILSGNGSSIWSTNASIAAANSSTAKLLDSGNLVLTDDSSQVVTWQSFDQPSDTLLEGMKIGMNRKTGTTQFLTSWQSPENPASGKFSVGLDNQVFAQLVLWEGSKKRWRSGPWNGGTFTGIPEMIKVYLYGFTLISDNKGGMYFTFSVSPDSSGVAKLVIDSSGLFNETDWIEGNIDWTVSWSQPITPCDIYGRCGPNGYCTQKSSHICNCLPGFIPKSPQDWVLGKWLDGCLRRTELDCGKNSSDSVRNREGDEFLKLTGMKLPDESDWAAVLDLKSCEDECIKNCSCVAYAFVNGIGCMLSVGDLIDLQQFSSGGQDLYLRIAASELGEKRNVLAIVLAVTLSGGGGIIIGLVTYFVWQWKGKRELQGKDKSDQALLFNLGASIDEASENGNREEKPTDLPLFDLSVTVAATNNFSKENKLGEGGFGPVYKGIMPDGRQLAVKRLSRSSSQGLEEFKNEVIVISKLQHRNLVRLLGCCIQEEEKLLIYEYMPNKSLDALLFDPVRGAQLDWRKRFHIIEGIARGLLYLHRDSRLRIIHRDLKASNILLDDQMNPKISDFGMARIFGGNQAQENTKRVVGTIGYMSPEYALQGQFSEKSDVFSFGVLLLEILTGSRNTSFYHPELNLSLLGYAWHLWSQEKGLDLVDPLIAHSFNKGEVLKCIHVALLCVQDGASNRPTMSYVVSMLDSEATTLATPKQPTFIIERHPICTNLPTHNVRNNSTADLTLTVVEGR